MLKDEVKEKEDIIEEVKENNIEENNSNENEVVEEKTCCENKDKSNKEENIEEDIEKLKEELEDWKQSYLRKQADFQNFSKRKEKEMEELRKFSSEKIITKFLGSLDNLERAVEASSETKDFDGLIKGVKMIIGGLKDIMLSEGVKEIEASGEYDPQFHHAVSVEEEPELKENEIIRVLQKGYTMKGKVIRPAMVSVVGKK